jgi:outer membrane protein TolC
MPDSSVEGLSGLDSALAALASVADKAANNGIGEWAVSMESQVKNAARASDRMSKMVSRSVVAKRTKGGQLSVGGSGTLPTGTGTYGDVFWGAEFGGGARPETRQFRAWQPRGYWFFPTIEPAEDTSLIDAAEKGLDAAVARWRA